MRVLTNFSECFGPLSHGQPMSFLRGSRKMGKVLTATGPERSQALQGHWLPSPFFPKEASPLPPRYFPGKSNKFFPCLLSGGLCWTWDSSSASLVSGSTLRASLSCCCRLRWGSTCAALYVGGLDLISRTERFLEHQVRDTPEVQAPNKQNPFSH